MEATGKRHIFLTGDKGAGKSTLFNRMVGEFPCIRTHAVSGQGVYAQDICIGRYDAALPGQDRKMRPVEAGFRQMEMLLQELEHADADWVALDEVGYLEPAWYLEKLEALMENKHLLAAVRKDHPILQREDALIVDLDGHRYGCVVMASGEGKRFGGNKLLADLNGKPLVCHGLDRARAVFSQTVVVTRYEAVAKLHAQAVLHDLPHRSDTVRLGLQALGDADGCLFLPGDQPFVTEESLQALVLAAQNEDAIWQLGDGSPVLFPRWAFAELMQLPEGKGGNVLIRKYGAKSLACDGKEQTDIDTKEMYHLICTEASL